jgi:hypothetical protein
MLAAGTRAVAGANAAVFHHRRADAVAARRAVVDALA